MKVDIDKNPGMLSMVTHINGKKIGKPIREKGSDGKWRLTEYGEKRQKREIAKKMAYKMPTMSTSDKVKAKAEKGEKQQKKINWKEIARLNKPSHMGTYRRFKKELEK